MSKKELKIQETEPVDEDNNRLARLFEVLVRADKELRKKEPMDESDGS